MTLENRVAIISGATGVTGRLAARALAAQGASLALLGSTQSKLDALVEEVHIPEERILTHVADLRERTAVFEAARAVQAKFGRADILLHLVGGWTGGKTLVETPLEDMQNMLDQHLWTTFYITQAFLPQLTQNGWGRMIIISSPLAVRPTAKMGAYAIAKAAEETLLLTIAQEAKDNGVTANIIQVRSIDVKNQGKGTSPDEIVATILRLCSDEAAKTNAERIPLFRNAR
jgi:NAD(P)-dependent dehydrogenase (short-subunit alcohol dehydrogenase family)